MGKRKDMTSVDLKEIMHSDHSVFGHSVIARQSTPEIKEASMFVEKPLPGNRKLEKAKSDNSMVLKSNGTNSDFKYNGINYKEGENAKEISIRHWRSAEFTTKSEQRNMSSDYFNYRQKSTLVTSTNGHSSLHCSSSQSSDSNETLSNGSRDLSLYSRKSILFHASSSLSRESSIEEQTEDDDDDKSVNGENRERGISGKVDNRRVSELLDELLLDIYGKWSCDGNQIPFGRRRCSTNSSAYESDYCTTTGSSPTWKIQSCSSAQRFNDSLQRERLSARSVPELEALVASRRFDVQYAGSILVRQLKRRDALISRRDKQNDVVTAFLQALSEKRSQDTRIRFSVMPYPGDSGFTQWRDAMKMVARLPGGIPPEFRKRLWLTVAEKHLQSRGVDWTHAEKFCFNEWTNPDDEELGVQIVKDLHRTGCSLFCGAAAEENQALLKRVLLAYARWNKAVGYCQGFNMLAALILQVMDRSETDSVKVMIYLIEGVLPESYFANNLRGLSVDMAVFRDLLRLRLPTLSRHLEQLQHDTRDSATGTSYEPPLTNVFTMQWFLTLFSNCLPQPTVLRVWDLIFLEGNEVLLRTALAIWDGLADRIMAVDSADEFYSIMGVLTREMLEFGLMDTNKLIKTIVTIAPFPFPELPELRDKYLYNITPWTHTVSTAARRGLRLFYSDDDDDGTDEDDEKIAVAAAYGVSAVFRSPRRKDSLTRASSPSSPLSTLNYGTAPERDRLALDISALKQQYAKLRERQRQAHIILTACARQPLGPSVPTPVAMNHLLLGKSALLSVRGRRGGPPPGAVPPPASITLKSAPKQQRGRQQQRITPQGQLITASNVEVVSPQIQQQQEEKSGGETLHWKDTGQRRQRRGSQLDATVVQSVVSVDAEEIQGIRQEAIVRGAVPVIIQPELGTDVTGKELDADSDDSKSSTSTELCDEPDRLSDFDSEEPTSVSDTSSHVVSTAEASVTKLPFLPPADRSGLPTPESPLRNGVSPLTPVKNTIVPPKSGESFVSDTKPTIILPSKETEILTTVISPTSATDDLISSSALKENFELTSQRETSLPAANVSASKLSPLKEISVCATTPEIYFSVVDNDVKPLISEDNETMNLNEIITVSEHDHSKQSLSDKPESSVGNNISRTGILDESSVSSEQFSSFHTSELKMQASEEGNNDEIIPREEKDIHYGSETKKYVEINEVESDTHFIKHPDAYPSGSVLMEVEGKTEERIADNISADLTSAKITDSSMSKGTFKLGITQKDHWGTVDSLESPVTGTRQYIHGTSPLSPQSGDFFLSTPAKMLHDTRESDDETEEELKTEIKICRICTERSIPEIDTSCVVFGDVAECDTAGTEALQDLGSFENTSVNVSDGENISKLLELNQRLQGREQAVTVEDIADSDVSEIDYAEMSNLLDIEHNISLGRRNSERALKIIQENSEILHRILQCQTRRPSKVSEEDTSGGTTTIPSETDSIPTSSSAENVDIASNELLRSVTDVPKTGSIDSFLAVANPEHGISVKLPSLVSLNSPNSIHSILRSDKAVEVFPRDPQIEGGMSMESQGCQQEKEEDGTVITAECFDTRDSSVPFMTEEFLKAYNFSKPKQNNIVSSPRSAVRFSMSSEAPSKEHSAFSIDSRSVKPKTELVDVTQVPLPSDEQFLSQSEDRTASELTRFSDEDSGSSISSETVKQKTEFSYLPKLSISTDEKFLLQSEDRYYPELTGSSDHSSYPFDDNVHHAERTIHRPTELELDRVHSPSTTQSSWERFSSVDSVFPKFPKNYLPERKTQISYCSYSSKCEKESLQLLDPTVIPVTDVKALTPIKCTDDGGGSDGDIKTVEHLAVDKTSSDFDTVTSFSKFSLDSSPDLCHSVEKCKLKDDSSPIRSTIDSRDLCAGSNYTTKTSDFSTSKPYISISRYEYSPTRTKSWNIEKECNTDHVEHDNFKHRETPSSMNTKDSASHSSDNIVFKSSSAKSEITPADYLQTSPSFKSRLVEDFQYHVRPDSASSSDFSSGIQDVVHRTTTRNHGRPHSTIISDVTSTEILNRSYSSSSIDGCIMRIGQDLSSPSASSRNERSVPSFKSVGDVSSSVAVNRTQNSVYNPMYEINSSIKVPDTVQYTRSAKSPSELRFTTKDLSPRSWDKDDPSSSVKSECIKENSNYQTLSSSSSKIKVEKSYSPTVSPAKCKDIHVSLPPIKSSVLGSPTKLKSNFDPFPPRPALRQPKELGIKLGLYSTDCVNKNGKAASKNT
ncbi:uncharacterized protein LOC110827030 isoform X2 [Zootermopsis nevadensis]|uniref:uncharacterized protein LOC110827030 isoform X2 n=1 Tax=Zootermopsis nevadensis TaxID=136037 RepID=UPI000B8EC3D7|nr:uncharacterized protein LOC110827030 isoform X2 [Zootermopsis nevadensis]